MNRSSFISIFIFISFFSNINFNALSAQTFTRITTGSIATDTGLSKAVTWSDYNNDGNVDLFVPNTIFEENFLYLNNGDGTFTKILSSTIVNDGGNPLTANSETATWGDFDNDGELDVFISYNGPKNQLHLNNGDGTFTKITSGSIVNDGGGSRATASGDYNNDGFLDVFVANRFGENNFLYKNNGDGSFTKIISGPVVNDGGDSQGCAWADYDNDGFLDLLVTNASDNFLYNNNGDGTFTKITTSPILNYFGPGGSWGDYNNDGFLDLFITNSQQNEPNALFKNNGDGTFTRITEGSIVNDLGISRGSAWGDHDNDGDLDLVVANGVLVASENNFLYSNNGDGTFTKILSGPVVNDGGLSLSVGWADYDNDGDLDLFVGNTSEVNFLYKNNGNQNNWLNLKLIGTSSNTAAIGAKVRVKALIDGTETWQMREISGQTGRGGQNSLNAEFGLGDASVIDAIEVEWPSGIVQNLADISVNQFLTITEEEVSITVTPSVPVPIIVPAGGSIFDMTVTVDNNSGSTLNAQVWNTVTLLDFGGEEIGPVGRIPVIPISVPAFGQFTTTFSNFEFAGGVRPGNYLFNWKVGTFPNGELDRDSFGFSKAAGPTLAKAGDDHWGLSPAKEARVPARFSLEQNYPNPFNPETEIRFQLPEASQVLVRIFNTLGQEIRTLTDREYEAGFHSVRWDSNDNNGNAVSSGIYLYQLQAGSFSQIKKMTLLR